MATAEAARPGANTPDGTLLNQMLRSYFRIEDDKNSMRQSHRTNLGKLTAQQGEVIERVRDGGYSVRAFKELLNEEKDRRRIANRKSKLEDDDADAVEAMRAALGSFADSPLAQAAIAAAGGSKPDDDDFESEDIRSTDQKEAEAYRKEHEAARNGAPAAEARQERRARKNAALDAVTGNGAEKLAEGIKPLA